MKLLTEMMLEAVHSWKWKEETQILEPEQEVQEETCHKDLLVSYLFEVFQHLKDLSDTYDAACDAFF